MAHVLPMPIWQDINFDDDMINHLFEALLPNYNFNANVEKIDTPIITVGGELDYDSIPLKIWDYYQKPLNFNLVSCKKVGHWPHIEAPDIFDAEVLKWADKIN